MLAKIRQFIAPPQFPEDDEKARAANLLNTLLWLFVAVFLALTVAVHFIDNDVTTTLQIAAVPAFSLGLIYVLKRGYVRAASRLTMTIFYTGTLAAAYFDSGMNLGIVTSLMTMGVLVGLLLGRRAVNIYAVLTIIISGIFVYWESTGQIVVAAEGSLPIYLSAAASFAIMVIALNSTLRDLQSAFSRMRHSNEELVTIHEGLEKTVAERTRDLALAADVGRSMSQIRQLDELLQNAVNSIQERFNLYYAQIYLTDKREKTLSLKAGTGFVGRQLVRRGHVLSVGKGSINGTAVAEKRTVVVSDTAASPVFKPNALLPYTRAEMAIPLILGDRVLGVLNLQSDEVQGLSEQNVNAFETLAGQMAVAIENANLFAETQEARAQVEGYVGLMVREGWDNYQNGVVQPELVGFTFENDLLKRLTQPKPVSGSGTANMVVPIVVANETIGTIQLETEVGHVWAEEEKEMIQAVARQVGQQAENLRLLAETRQYRAEAEQIARRLSGEAWHTFLQERGEAVQGFVYDQNKIEPLAGETVPELPEAEVIRRPLQVQNETIGEIVVTGAEEEDDAGLIAAVSEQLSAHMENLRLAKQTEMALAQSDTLYQIGRDLNSADTPEKILLAALKPMMPTNLAEATLLMFADKNETNEPETLEMLADWQRDGQPAYPVGTRFPVSRFPLSGTFFGNAEKPILISDVLNDERVDVFTQDIMTQAGIGAIAMVPLSVAGEWVGILTGSWKTAHPFTLQEEELFNALVNLVAPTAQSQRLFTQTKTQADKERLINLINQRIQGTLTIDSALQTAVKELGQALRTPAQVKLTTAVKQQEAVAAD